MTQPPAADAILYRLRTSDQGTFGRMVLGSKAWFSGELPWRDNRSNVSCIPAGRYKVVWARSPRLKKFTYRLLGVPGHDGVLIHSANLMGDASKGYKCQLKGCIALGEKLGTMDGQEALLVSAPAVRNFEEALGRKSFMLEIVDVE